MPKKRKKRRMRKRRWFTTTELVEIWDRWQRGESTKAIGRVLDRGGDVDSSPTGRVWRHPSAAPLPFIPDPNSDRA